MFSVLLVVLAAFGCQADFEATVEYSFDDWATSHPFGKVHFSSMEENYTASIDLTGEKSLGQKILSASSNSPPSLYRLRARSSLHPDRELLTSTNPSDLPTPDTQSYLEKIEKEKRARQHGAENDNRSFLQKYWMYIVPVVLFLFVSNMVNPEAQAEQ